MKKIFLIYLIFLCLLSKSYAQNTIFDTIKYIRVSALDLRVKKSNISIAKTIFDTIPSFVGLKAVQVTDSNKVTYGFLGDKGKFTIPPIYDSIGTFRNGRVVLGSYFPDLDSSQLFVGVYSQHNFPLVPISYINIIDDCSGILFAKNRLHQWAIYDTTGTQLQPPQFDSVYFKKQNKSIWVRKDGKWGVLNIKGRYNAYPIYKSFSIDSLENVTPIQFNEFQYFNTKLEAQLTIKADSIVNFSEGYFQYFQNEKVGLKTKESDTKAIYTFVGKVINERAVAGKQSKYGLLNNQGKELLPFVYDSIMIDHSEFIRLKTNGKWGIVNRVYFPKVASNYFFIKNFSNGLAAALGDNKLWGYVNAVGDTTIPFQYDYVSDFEGGLAEVGAGDSLFVINKIGEMVVTPADMPRFSQGAGKVINNKPVVYTFPIDYYEKYEKLIDGITLVTCGKEYGLLGKKGNEMFPAICDTVVYDPDLQIATFHCDTMAGVVDKFSNYVHPLLYNFDTIHAYHQGCALAKKKGYYGGIDILKNIRVAPQYEQMLHFKDGHWGIYLNGKWGFTDINEAVVVQPNYDTIMPFNGKAAGIKYKGRWNLISDKDKAMNVADYDSISPTDKGTWVLYNEGLEGLTNQQGAEMIVCRYEKIKDLGDGLVQVWKNNKTGVINQFQDVLIPLVYKEIKYDELNDNFIFIKYFE